MVSVWNLRNRMQTSQFVTDAQSLWKSVLHIIQICLHFSTEHSQFVQHRAYCHYGELNVF